MNTSRLADVSEIVSSIAIVITLIFLTLQTKQNTRAIEATTRHAALIEDTQFLTNAINHPEIILSWTKPKLTSEEIIRLNESLILFFRNRESDFAQYQQGVMDKPTWERYISSITSVLLWERTRNWWYNMSAAFDPDFVAEVNRLLDKSPIYQGQSREWINALYKSPVEYQKMILLSPRTPRTPRTPRKLKFIQEWLKNIIREI